MLEFSQCTSNTTRLATQVHVASNIELEVPTCLGGGIQNLVAEEAFCGVAVLGVLERGWPVTQIAGLAGGECWTAKAIIGLHPCRREVAFST